MPMDRRRYPRDWEAIGDRIRARAGNRCEHPGCGALHGSVIVRDADERPIEAESPAAVEAYYAGGKMVRIVNTVHHIGVAKPDGSPGDPDDKHDCRDENLILLCQMHHLRADAPLNARKAAETRRRRREAGQLRLAIEAHEEATPCPG